VSNVKALHTGITLLANAVSLPPRPNTPPAVTARNPLIAARREIFPMTGFVKWSKCDELICAFSYAGNALIISPINASYTMPERRFL
jgi:hypothetical protein